MVGTVKKAMTIWSPEKGTFIDFLQRVLMTYRSSRLAGSRSSTPAEIVFGRQIRHPLIRFSGGQWLWYFGRKGRPATKVQFLVQRSPHTIYIETEDGNIALAHVDQVKSLGGETTEELEKEECDNEGDRCQAMKQDEAYSEVMEKNVEKKIKRNIIKPSRYRA
jgi:hypothetical protein